MGKIRNIIYLISIGILMVASILCFVFMNQKEKTINTVEEPIEIVYAHFQGEGDAMYHSIQDAIARFELDYPDVVIKQEYYPSDAYGMRLEQWNNENTMRDITMIQGVNIETYVENNSIMDITELVIDYGVTRKIEPQYFTEHTMDKKIYGVPWEKASYGFIMYNKGIFNEAGIENFPTTLEELIQAGKRIREAGYTPMALGNKLLWPLDSILFSAFVNNYVGNDWYERILSMDDTVSFMDEEFVQALEDFQKLGASGFFNEDFSDMDNEKRGEMYQNREVAMISAGNWECRSTTELVPEVSEDTYIALWPSTEQGTLLQNSLVMSSAWGLSLGSQIEDEKIKYAMTFISEYICSDEFARILMEEQGVETAWGCIYDSSVINVISKRQLEVAQNQHANYCKNWDSTLPVSIKTIYQKGLQDILLGVETPRNLAEKMEDERDLLMEN